MRAFLLLSALLHVGLGWLLWQIPASRHDMPLPGQPLQLTLTTFREPASATHGNTARMQASRQESAAALTPKQAPSTTARKHLAGTRPEPSIGKRTPPPPAADARTDARPLPEVQPESLARAPQSAPGDQATRQSVRAALYSALYARFKYPRRARVRGWEGTVVVSLRIMPDGALRDVQLADSCGIPLLDRAAVRALARLQVPKAIAWLDGREMDMLVPVEYRLTDS